MAPCGALQVRAPEKIKMRAPPHKIRRARGTMATGVSDLASFVFFFDLSNFFDNWVPACGPQTPQSPARPPLGASLPDLGAPRVDFY